MEPAALLASLQQQTQSSQYAQAEATLVQLKVRAIPQTWCHHVQLCCAVVVVLQLLVLVVGSVTLPHFKASYDLYICVCMGPAIGMLYLLCFDDVIS